MSEIKFRGADLSVVCLFSTGHILVHLNMTRETLLSRREISMLREYVLELAKLGRYVDAISLPHGKKNIN